MFLLLSNSKMYVVVCDEISVPSVTDCLTWVIEVDYLFFIVSAKQLQASHNLCVVWLSLCFFK